MSAPLLTEAQAKGKWCPFARSYDEFRDGPAAGMNRGNQGAAPIDCLCLASGCMAWRWEGATRPRQKATHFAEVKAWMEANPRPSYEWRWWATPIGQDEPEDIRTARLASEEWEAKALAFVATLAQPDEAPPDALDDTWEWSAGFDEADAAIFVGWAAHGGVPTGYCGLAGSPLS